MVKELGVTPAVVDTVPVIVALSLVLMVPPLVVPPPPPPTLPQPLKTIVVRTASAKYRRQRWKTDLGKKDFACLLFMIAAPPQNYRCTFFAFISPALFTTVRP